MTPSDSESARSQLAAAEEARDRMAAGLRLPAGLFPALAAAIAFQIGSAGMGIASQTTGGLAVLLAGIVAFMGVAGWSLQRFRVINGARVDGLASRVVLGTGAISTGSYVVAFGASTWAAFESQWWLVVLAAIVGGVGYAFGARQWWDAYRGDPAAHSGGASPRMLAGLAVATCLGFVALLVLA